MTVRVNKQPFNIREKFSEVERPIGVKGNELMRAETAQDARDLVSAGRKNMIINGAMQVAQRIAYPNTQPGASYANYYTVDRWRFNIENTHFGTWTFSQSNTVPSGKGFAYSWKWDCTTADTSLDSSHFGIAEYRIEAQDLQHLEYGTSSAKPITLSFWVKTNKTGTYAFSIYSGDGSRYVSKTYTVDVANAWEHKTITIEGDTAGTINNDTGDGFRMWWWLGAGTGFTSGTMYPGVWRPWSESNGAAPGLSVNMADSTSNEWFITGVQMEVGRNATEFEHRSYGEELALCQRYYQVHDGEHFQVVSSATGSSADFYTTLAYWVPMNHTPDVTQSYTLSGATTNNLVAVTATKAKFSLRPSSANTEIYVTADTLRLDAEI